MPTTSDTTSMEENKEEGLNSVPETNNNEEKGGEETPSDTKQDEEVERQMFSPQTCTDEASFASAINSEEMEGETVDEAKQQTPSPEMNSEEMEEETASQQTGPSSLFDKAPPVPEQANPSIEEEPMPKSSMVSFVEPATAVPSTLTSSRSALLTKSKDLNVSFKNRTTSFTVSFENLTIHVPRRKEKLCSFLEPHLQEYCGFSMKEKEAFYALDRVSGYVSTGEMCLVLGPNEESKSTLLRALCGNLNSADEQHGTVMLDGIPLDPSASQGWRRMSSYVAASDSTHSPVLTVKETFEFAAQCTSDGSSSDDRIDAQVRLWLESLGLDHVADTVVGDENLRGVSGGQKRRVTVGEMMIDPDSSFFCLENITDGLASTDSVQLIRNIRRSCKSQGIAGFISLLQPSDEMVTQFDKILVLTNNGGMSYFGPVDRNLLGRVFLGDEHYDESLDTGSIADLILDQGGSSASKYNTEYEREAATIQRYIATEEYDTLIRDMARIRANAPPGHVGEFGEMMPEGKYSTNGAYQFQIIAKRRFKLIMRNPMTYSRVCIAIVFGIITGSLFSVLKQDLIGSLGRTGYMFLNSFLVLMLSSAVTLPESFRQRPTLFKHRAAEFYSGRIAYITQVFLDIPLSILEATIMATISYFWVGMNPGANHFFFFVAVLIGLEFVGQSFGRLLCAVMRKQVSASAVSSVSILVFAAVAGFMPAYRSIVWLIRWASWLTPVSYAFEAMMLNEFDGRSLAGVVLANDSGQTSIGRITGNQWLDGLGIPRAAWGTPTQIKIFDLFMLFVWAIIYDSVGMYFVEFTRKWNSNKIRRSQSRVREKDSEQQERPNLNYDIGTGTSIESTDTEWPQTLSATNLCYTVPIKGPKGCSIDSVLGPCLAKCYGKNTAADDESTQDDKPKHLQLLNNVTAQFRRGRMTALMGSSGAGKTTLMDVIAGYKTGGTIAGQIMIDGHPKEDGVWRKISGYAEQQDIMNPYLSVLETLRFTAACRLHPDVDQSAVIQRTVQLMGIEDYLSMVIGKEKEGEGLPKHVRKRLTIAIQLVVQPRILFLDEPTTGLGNSEASLVIGAIRRATDQLQLITVATIHQPSRHMFESFDDFLLVAKGGRVSYMGELGKGSETLLRYFSKLTNEDFPTSVNPPDYVLTTLDKITADVAVSSWSSSDENRTLSDSIQDQKVLLLGGEEEASSSPPPPWTTDERFYDDATNFKRKCGSFCTEFVRLTRRHFVCQLRNPSYSFIRMSVSIWVSLFLGVLFFGDKSTIEGAVYSIGGIFFLVFVLVIPMQTAIVPLIEDRAVLYREAMSGLYGRLSYGLGQLCADVPFHLVNTILMFICFYLLMGFKLDGGSVGYFLLALLFANWLITSMGQMYALLLPNEEAASGLAGLSVILSVMLMGFLITVHAMPNGWVWGYWANMFRYILQGIVTNELGGNSYHIDLPSLNLGPVNGNSTVNFTQPDFGMDMDVLTTRRRNLESSLWSSSSEEPTELVLFGPGTDGTTTFNSPAIQSANLASLLQNSGPGRNKNETNQAAGLVALADLVQCLIQNDCLVQPNLPSNFMSCTVIPPSFRRPPVCKEQFNTALDTLPVDEILNCFRDDFPVAYELETRGVPSSVTKESFNSLNATDQVGVVQCLVTTIVPESFIRAVDAIIRIVKDLYQLLLIVVDVFQNGIDLPGDLILFFFGWSEWESGEGFVSPFKWHYCMTAMLTFLVGIETIKLLSVRFIVWTKR